MKTSLLRAAALSFLLAATVALSATHAGAATLSFHVDLDPTSLISNTATPFALDFQLGAGNGLSNTVTLSGFTFQGGNPTGTGTASGSASGDLATSLILMDLNTINEYYQTFSANVTRIGFNVTTTLNPSSGVPDLFTVSILDDQLNPIRTNSPGLGTSAATDYLVGVQIDDHTAFSSVRTYTSNVAGSTTLGVTALASAAVPEPASFVSIGLAALGLGAWAGLRRGRAARP